MQGCPSHYIICHLRIQVTIIKEFEDTCSSQMVKLGECLNPWGVSRGTILRCIGFIFLTWAVRSSRAHSLPQCVKTMHD